MTTVRINHLDNMILATSFDNMILYLSNTREVYCYSLLSNETNVHTNYKRK